MGVLSIRTALYSRLIMWPVKKNAQQYSTLPKQTLKKLLKKTIHFASCIKMLLAENNNNQEYYIIHTSAQE